MTNSLIVKNDIHIHADPSTVWKVLTEPKYVAQWDELPEDYPEEAMTIGSKVTWDLPNGGQTITKVIRAEQEEELIVDLYVSTWDTRPEEGDVVYRYNLKPHNGETHLFIEIGDFSLVEDGEMYYDASVEFAEEAKKKIKELSEET
ncbi:hypothetical protein CEY16_11175 [Halalkalibacillus sediminis]|uniref:Activator of Hsp90 ATPase homologue 1/2-like C-terminal domain-containing protein n=1 Tax=Halalkalibacillus sediminis TaxID=2018042 RepID=A0A2I0QSI0_9BACI|nr:SRPBCC domain-containing protein [Halalkalibacillus sediminis]PKR77291.1 hypothetical protein CEY16_11175 [Halalkalibacillus sediminis]